jgi:hypothetical protein
MNITEKNILLSEFMEVNYSEELNKLRDAYEISQDDQPLKMYHNSWEWLMPVVIKIEKTTSISIDISCDNCQAFDCHEQKILFVEETEKMQSTYEVVVKVVQQILNK